MSRSCRLAMVALCCCGALAACTTPAQLEKDDRQCRAQTLPDAVSETPLTSYDRCMERKGHPRFAR